MKSWSASRQIVVTVAATGVVVFLGLFVVGDRALVEATRVHPLPEEFGVLGASAGVACFPEDAQDGTGLIARADTALYQVKETKRGKVLRLKAS